MASDHQGGREAPKRPDAAPEDPRGRLAGAQRVVVKVGSSSLTTADHHLDPARVVALVDALAAVRAQGRQVVLVSSGAIAAGLGPLGLTRRPRDLAGQQAAASVGQGLLIERYARRFQDHGLTVGQVLLTVEDTTRRASYGNAWRTLERLLDLGVVPIVNENDTVATQEIRFGDNDRLAALVAQLVRADALALLSDVDGLYNAHPSDPSARLIERVDSLDELDRLQIDTAGRGSDVGSGGMTTKLESVRLALGAGIPVVLARGDQAGAALSGQPVGTVFQADRRRRRSRLNWLAHASKASGELVLDAGAVQALRATAASLLPAGITAARGDFMTGDVVRLVDAQGEVVGRGIVNYDAAVLPELLGHGTRELACRLGPAFARVVVHRDQLVVRRAARP